MQGRVPEHRDPNAPRWGAAIALALLWHAVVFALLQFSDPFAPREVEAASPAPVELTFRPRPLPPRTVDEDEVPRRFTELPPDRADTRPERPDAMSNVDSRARDRAEDDSRSDLPRMEGRAEAPAVAMDAAPVALVDEAALGVPVPEQPDADAADPAQQERMPEALPSPDAPTLEGDPGEVAETGEQNRLQVPGVAVLDRSASPPPRAGDPLARDRQPGTDLPETQPRFLIGSGRDDVFQEEGDHRRGNVPLFGDLSLNTVAWEYAPWLQRFVREFRRNWLPPYAYFALGVIKGHQVVFLEIAPDGTLLRLEVQEEVGHDSLRESTVGNFRSLAPYHPLPKDFPEQTLQLTVKVVYPGPR
jgi:hypothetical protein